MSSPTPTKTIGILNGSFRKGGNNAGIAAWIASRFKHVEESQTSSSEITLHTIDTNTHPFPLGPVVDPIIPMTIKSSSDYPSSKVSEWSRLVKSFSGLIVISPQYNWGYPGELKNALDNIYHEWNDSPVVIITYGGHGGGKAGLQLRQVMQGGLHVKLVSQGDLEITLPREYIAGESRVSCGNDGHNDWKIKDDFLSKYEETADEVINKLIKEVLDGER